MEIDAKIVETIEENYDFWVFFKNYLQFIDDDHLSRTISQDTRKWSKGCSLVGT